MMRQSEFKKKLDPELGRYTKKHIYGEGIMDVFNSVGKKIFGQTIKKAAKKGVEKAVTTAATKTGEHVGKKAGDKIVQMLSMGDSPKTPTKKKVTFNKNNKKIQNKKLTQQQINARVNSILSGGKII